MTERSLPRPKPLPGARKRLSKCPRIVDTVSQLPNITIQLNGDPYVIDGDASLTTLIETLKMKPTRIAVELNREVVPKADYAKISLREGDELELINFVGGG